jgi:hypothetical protein
VNKAKKSNEDSTEAVWKAAALILKSYVDSLTDRCATQHCRAFWYTREFHKLHIKDLVRGEATGDVWLCIYYSELFLIEIYIKFQQADELPALMKKFGALVKTQYMQIFGAKTVVHHINYLESTRHFEVMLLKAKMRLRVINDIDGSTKALFKAYRFY